VSPQAKRQCVRHLQQEHTHSERQACTLVGVARSTARYQATKRPDEQVLRAQIRQLANKHKRYGCPRITHLLHRAGIQVNKKRVHRIWKDEGLQMPRRKVKKRRVGPKGEVLMRAQHSNHVWTYDFIHDRTEHGGQLRILSVLDEFSRRCLAILVGRSITSKDVIHLLEWLFQQHGAPKHLRSDNGPEFIACAVQRWLPQQHCDTIYITPGSPWENPYIESFFDKLRQECLNGYLFVNVQEAQSICEQWRQEYNQYRPHSSLNYMTPDEFIRHHEAIPENETASTPRPGGTRTDESGKGEFVHSDLPIPLQFDVARHIDTMDGIWQAT
jgi:putative transposase